VHAVNERYRGRARSLRSNGFTRPFVVHPLRKKRVSGGATGNGGHPTPVGRPYFVIHPSNDAALEYGSNTSPRIAPR
jgi:hypothetical protein